MEQVNFKMVGKLVLPRETDTFKPYEERTTAKGNGKMFNLSFNCQMLNKVGKPSGNQSMLRLSEYMPNDLSSKGLYAYVNDGYDASKNKWTGHSERIEWSKRNDPELLDKVANFTKYVIDLEEPKVRIALRNIEKCQINDRPITDKDLKDAKLESANDISEAIKKSRAKRKEFISKYDFILFLHKLLSDEKLQTVFGERQFLVEGTHEFNYSMATKKWYETFNPTHIYLQSKDAISYAHEDVEFLYGVDSLNDTLDELGKYIVSGWVRIREEFSRKVMFAPYKLTVLKTRTGNDEKDAKADQLRMKRFTVEDDDSIRCMGVVANIFNGTELLEITEDDLTEEQQESILMGDCTLADIQKELGGKRSGRLTENRFFKLMSGYSKGWEETAYSRDMMNNQEEDEDTDLFEDEVSSDDVDTDTSIETTSTSDDEEDIFDDFDDLL